MVIYMCQWVTHTHYYVGVRWRNLFHIVYIFTRDSTCANAIVIDTLVDVIYDECYPVSTLSALARSICKDWYTRFKNAITSAVTHAIIHAMNAAYIHQDLMRFTVWRRRCTGNWTSCELIYVHVYTCTYYIYIYCVHIWTGMEWVDERLFDESDAVDRPLIEGLTLFTVLGRPGKPLQSWTAPGV